MSFSIGEWHEGIPIFDSREALVATTIRPPETAARGVGKAALWVAGEEWTEC